MKRYILQLIEQDVYFENLDLTDIENSDVTSNLYKAEKFTENDIDFLFNTNENNVKIVEEYVKQVFNTQIAIIQVLTND